MFKEIAILNISTLPNSRICTAEWDLFPHTLTSLAYSDLSCLASLLFTFRKVEKSLMQLVLKMHCLHHVSDIGHGPETVISASLNHYGAFCQSCLLGCAFLSTVPPVGPKKRSHCFLQFTQIAARHHFWGGGRLFYVCIAKSSPLILNVSDSFYFSNQMSLAILPCVLCWLVLLFIQIPLLGYIYLATPFFSRVPCKWARLWWACERCKKQTMIPIRSPGVCLGGWRRRVEFVASFFVGSYTDWRTFHDAMLYNIYRHTRIYFVDRDVE